MIKLAEGIEKRCFQVAGTIPEFAVPPETKPRIRVMAKVIVGTISAPQHIEGNQEPSPCSPPNAGTVPAFSNKNRLQVIEAVLCI